MNVITLEQVKAQLGITGPTYDAQITAKLPIIDAKVKAICKNNFNLRFAADLTSGETECTAYPLYKTRDNYPSGINNYAITRDISKSLEVGMQVEGDNIPSGAYIESFYKSGSTDILGTVYDMVYLTLSEAATDDGEGVYITGGISIAYLDVIAKGVQWMINKTSQSIDDSNWSSRSVGPLSVTKSSANEKIDGKSGMPAWFVRGLPRYI